MNLTRYIAGAALLGLATTGIAGAASATTPSTNPARLQAIQTAAKTAIANRESALSTVVSILDNTGYLGSDQALLVGRAQTDESDLTALGNQIAGDTTVQQARTDAETIFTGYRVFALVVPVDHDVRAADAATNVAIPALQKAAAAFTADNNPAIAAPLADMQSKIVAAQQALNGFTGQVEALTPAGWNTNHALLAPYKTSLAAARQDLGGARDDAKTILKDLGSSSSPSPATSTTAA
jgi:hypothetical protein